MVVAVGLPAVAQPRDPFGERAIVGDDGAAVAERSEVLRRIKTEGAGRADGADRPSAGGGEMRLTAVLDNGEMMSRGDVLDRGHVGCLPVEMNRHDGAGAGTDRAFDAGRIDGQPRRVDIGEDRARACHHDRERRVRGGERRRDDLVAAADAERSQDERERVRAGADADRVCRAASASELRFERLDLRSKHEPAARDDAIDRRADRVGVFSRREAEERNAPRGHIGSVRSSSPMY